MIQEDLKKLFVRDLEKLIEEIVAYRKEENMWITDSNVTNSSGNLCLHLIGNLNTYLGAAIMKNGYKRNREYEFAARDVSRSILIEEIKKVITVVEQAFDVLTENDMSGNFPVQIWKEQTGMLFTLMHLHSHLNYHLGQIDYHRRLLDQ